MKTIRRLFMAAAVAVTAVILTCVFAFADDSGLCGDGVYWSFDSESGVLSVTGKGDMYDFVNEDYGEGEKLAPWIRLALEVKSLAVSDTVTGIGDYAFYNCHSLEKAETGDGVKRIGVCAFEGCTRLKTVILGKKVENIEFYAFNGFKGTAYYPHVSSKCAAAVSAYDGSPVNFTECGTGTLKSLTVSALPNKTAYCIGEKTDYSGLTLTAKWSDGFTQTVKPGGLYPDEVTVSQCDTSTAGRKSVKASFCSKTAEFNIGVHKGSVFTEDKSKYPESKHNYPDGASETKTYKCADAVKLEVKFSSKTFVENYGDFIYVNGKRYTGSELAGKTLTVNGGTLKIRLVSDESVNYYGYSIESIKVTKLEHVYPEKEELKKATLKSDGYRRVQCTVCDGIKSEKIISRVKKISIPVTSAVYNGKAQKPAVTVKNSKGKALEKGTAYTVKYSNNTAIGTAKVTVTLKGDYSGSKTLEFKIVPAQVTGLKASQTEKSITLKWGAVKGAKEYTVYSVEDSVRTKIATVKKTTAVIKKLKPGKVYKYCVQAAAPAGKGARSKTLTVCTKPKAPKMAGAVGGTGKAMVIWEKSTGAKGYEVFISDSKNGTYKKKGSTDKNSFVCSLKTGKTYYFKVRAYKSVSGNKVYSAFSAVKSCKIK